MPPQNNQNNNLNTPKKIVRTYATDLAKSVTEKGGEAFRIARVEEGIREKEAKVIAQQKKMNLLFGLSGLILIIASLAAYAYFSLQPKVILNPEPSPVAGSIIFFDSQNKFNVSSLDYDKILINYRKAITEAKIPAGQIEVLDFTENNQKVSLARFFNLLRINPPQGSGAYWDKNYFVGLWADTAGTWPFLILRTNSYRDISPAIIAWEDRMLDDLSPWLHIDVTGENNYLLQSKFDDLIVSNKETRAIKNKNGEIAIFYVFLDENHILFARNKGTLDEVLIRLFSPKK